MLATSRSPTSSADQTTYTITELAIEFDITPRAIRFYEDVGLITPDRAGRNRVYNQRDRTRLKLTLRGKRLGLSLQQIKPLVDMYDSPADTAPQLHAFMGVLQAHRHQLQRQLEDIQIMLDEIAEHEQRCARLLATGGALAAGRSRPRVEACLQAPARPPPTDYIYSCAGNGLTAGPVRRTQKSTAIQERAMTKPLQDLFDNNRRWARDIEARSPGFFTKLLNQQRPQYLWIGCADSRVPANDIVGMLPGELFVHRNVANVVVHSDLNCLSVMEFAVDLLQVKHIIVVGHYGCSGVNVALRSIRVGLASNWLRHVQDVRNRHRAWLDAVQPESLQLNALCELNVLEQALNVCQTTVVQDAWGRGQSVTVHGWVYGLHDGLLQDIAITVDGPDALAGAYAEALEGIRRRFNQHAADAA
jgi:carbonic anhydrase